ncbi:MAG TPA: aminomethyl-transferring glycine dehydrogenase subunit GcvPA [Firmicutes bacterium]|nr:aminomethyl-transferring glycine dehydrogenase subunit GcvPA [Bacillota bacterium]
MNYIPNTERDLREMLAAIGVGSAEELFSDIPAAVRLNRDLDLPPALSEYELIKHMSGLAARNRGVDDYVSFLGGGAYDHFIPSALFTILGRSEFYTAYTPYQAEVSQGVLQSIFEYQSLICELTGMDVSNASLYDGATAVAEAATMAARQTRRNEIVISRAVHPEYRMLLKTYAHALGLPVKEISFSGGITDLEELKSAVTGATACVILQSPNFFGCIEPMGEAADISHAEGALFVACVDPISLGILAPPGEYGADIAIGEGQALGNPLNFGGPYLGFLACKNEFIRNMPGRVVGETTDPRGRRGFVLTLQAREQHIRRERATSNICSNEALCALAATVYLSLLGKSGIREVGELCVQKSHYAAKRIASIPGFSMKYSAPFFKEFVIGCPVEPSSLIIELKGQGILPGIELARMLPQDENLKDALLVAVTEKRTKEEIDRLVQAMAQCAGAAVQSDVGATTQPAGDTRTERAAGDRGPACGREGLA